MSEPGPARDDRTLGAAAAACAALVFVVVASSAWLRLVAVPCPPAGCDGLTLADAVRLSHRVAAMGVSVLALVIAAVAWKSPARRGRRISAVALLLLVAVLALIGRRSAGVASPAVMLGNLFGGLALLALATGLAIAVRTPRGRLSIPFVAAIVLFAAAIITGGLLATAIQADSSSLGIAHRALSWVALAVWSFLGLGAAQQPGVRLVSRLTAILIAAQVVLALAFPGWPVVRWLHNFLTSAALCSAIAAMLASRANAPEDAGLSGRAPAGS
ncbi:MAG TPA: hypothetical protein VFV55_01960 [Usitatibacteraceae bacterium]|nr:hypothetical protein [Usitatibacteraceae bacterium]